eukprot:jgi/Mesvir1/24701/Mv21984-RA.1
MGSVRAPNKAGASKKAGAVKATGDKAGCGAADVVGRGGAADQVGAAGVGNPAAGAPPPTDQATRPAKKKSKPSLPPLELPPQRTVAKRAEVLTTADWAKYQVFTLYGDGLTYYGNPDPQDPYAGKKYDNHWRMVVKLVSLHMGWLQDILDHLCDKNVHSVCNSHAMCD